MSLQVGATWEHLLLASFSTCPPLIGEYLKLGLQATFTYDTLSVERVLSTYVLPLVNLLREFLENLQDNSSCNI